MSVNSTFVGSPAQLYGVVGTGNVVLASALPTTKAPVGHVFLTGYNASTALFSAGQPSTSDLSDWSDAGVVNGDVPVWNASLGMWAAGVLAYSQLSGTPTLPQNEPSVTHNFLTAYSSATGAFTQARPSAADLSDTATSGNVLRANGTNFVSAQLAYSDLSGTPQLAQTKANVSHAWLNSYSATTGLFTATQPSTSDLSDWSDAGIASGDVPIWNASLGQWVPGVPTVAAFCNPTAQSSAYNAVVGDFVICTTTSAGFTVTIPVAAAGNKGSKITVKKVSSDGNTLVVACSSNIDGQASWNISMQYASMDMISDGTTWWIV